MTTLSPRDLPNAALALKWVTAYTDFLAAALGLRGLLKNGFPQGVLQAVLADKVRTVTELADQFNSLGACPALRLAGDEHALWQAALAYAASDCWDTLATAAPVADRVASVRQSQRAWEDFCAAVQRLPDTFGDGIAVLDPLHLQPNRLGRLFQHRVRGCAAHEPADELVREEFDEPVVR